QLHRPAVAGHVGGAPAHDPAGQVPDGAGRAVEMGQPPVTSPPVHAAVKHPLCDPHEVSRALQVDLKSMPAPERPLASSVTPASLSIGELSERTGVPTSALR